MNKFYYIIIYIFSLLCYQNIYSQHFKQLSINNGLSSNKVFNIIKDNKKFIWIANFNGIDRFDGIRIKNYRLKNNGIFYRNDSTSKLFFCKDTVWVFTISRELYFYDYQSDMFVFVNIFPKFDILTNFFIDKKNNFLFTTRRGVFLITKKDSKETIKFNPNISHLKCNTICQSVDSIYWIGTDFGVFCYTINKSNNFLYLSNLPFYNELKDKKITSIFPDVYTDNIWISTSKGDLYLYNIYNKKFKNIQSKLQLPNLSITSIIQKSKNEIYISFLGAGIYVINTQHETLEKTYKHQDNNIYSLKGDNITSIFVDSDETLWASVLDDGISYINTNKPIFGILQHINNDEQSLNNNSIKSILEDNESNIWFGTNNGISILSKNNKWEHLFNNSTLKSTLTNSIKMSFDNKIYASIYLEGLVEIEKKGDKYQKIIIKNIDWPETKIHLIDSDNDFWFNNNENKINFYSSNQNINFNFSFNIWSIIEDSIKGEFYIGANPGFYFASKKTKTYTQIPINYKNFKSISRVFVLHKTTDRKIWIGSYEGLFLFDIKTKKIIFGTDGDGLYSKSIKGIIEDKSGKLWISTTTQITSYDYQKKQIYQYDSDDGLLNSTFQLNSNCYTKDGRILFGTENGAIVFKPEEIKRTTSEQNIVFTNFKIENSKNNATKFQNENIDNLNTIHLNSNESSFSIEFTAINFSNPNSINYSTILNGYNNWSTPSKNNTANFTDLKPGKYVFKVKTINNNSIIGINERKITIIIRPPFWNTFWAHCFYAILFSTLIFYFLFNRKRNSRNIKENVSTHQILENHNETTEQSSLSTSEIEQNNKFKLKIDEIINSNIDNQNLNVDFISEKMHLSRSPLYSKFRKQLGQSPADYINKIRMEKAITFLINDNLSVTETASRLGFSDASYFSKCFKTHFGVSPLKYKESKN